MKYCTKCGAQNDDNSNYCEACGAQLNTKNNAPQVYYSEKPLKKKSKIKGIFTFIGLLLILIAVIAYWPKTTSEPASTNINSEIEQSDNQETTKKYASLTPEEIYNEHNVVISTEKIEYGVSEVSIVFIVENNSDVDYSISPHAYDVNHIMAGDNIAGGGTTVPAGKKGRVSFDISNSDLEWLGIDNISDLGVIFWAYKDNFKDWDTGLIRVKTDMYDGQEIHLSEPLYEDDAVSLDFFDNSGADYMFIVENKTDYNVGCTFENCSINGWAYEVTDYSYDAYDELINSKTIAPINLHIDQDFLDKNNIDEITEIDFNIKFEDNNWNWNGDKYEYETELIELTVE